MTCVHAWLAAGLLALAVGQEPPRLRQAPDLSGYRLAKLELTGATVFPMQQLLDQFPIRPGDRLVVKSIKQGLDRIKRLYEESGHIDLSYVPYQDVDHAKKTMSFSFDILQGPQYIVNRIEWINSPDRVSDRALREACALEEGKVYRPSALDATVAAVNKLGVFRAITRDDYSVKRSPGYIDRVDVSITLRAKP